jgi:hypothetical protein
MRPQQQALVNSVRTRLNEIAQELLAGVEGAVPVPANPDIGYLLELGAATWARADNVDLDGRTYIDGYWGQCHWNTAMTAVRRADGVPAIGANQSALIVASPVRIFRGYAYFYSPNGQGNGWATHSWCMNGNTILETTGPMSAYFGAELNAQERQLFANHVAAYDPIQGHGGLGWGRDHEGHRIPVPAALIANTIGLPSVPQPPNAGEEEAGEEVAEANGAQPQAEGNVGAEGQPQSVQQAPGLQPQPAPNPAGGRGSGGLLRTWLLNGFVAVEARTKSDARALFKQQRPIPPRAKIE